ncbi:class I SAM-dependent methyltransferase [Salisediminibacterium selenitireducens]|uniref:Methyltransferase type 12 n=1 Tax=Bacillus selenitireducens (strain ATCC 700615 / DSM 15326 / MLS10) TaxID=439292 RepID=D6XUQ7_BACIE|nr:class I SAM-dependent methyltransferase [Salisediminibacterium selenitireducens]ADH99543.1 Methyltransferase type 12 [[Bacillus] selenitireducens MLS10]
MLSDYYDDIFPLKSSAVHLINDYIQSPGPVIDVACGTGNEAIELARSGICTIGIDLNESLIGSAKEKSSKLQGKSKFYSMNMLNLKDLHVSNASVIYCIGNSIVHMSSLNEIRIFLDQAWNALDDGGTLIIQTVNFDHMLGEKKTSLGDIKRTDPKLTFERYYTYKDERVEFTGVLHTDRGTSESSTLLLPLTAKEWTALVNQSKFSSIDMFGDFDLHPYAPDSPAFVGIIKK